MRLRSFAIVVLFFLIFFAGACIGKMMHSDYFVLQKEINLVHVLSVLCTVFVAVLVAVLIDRNKSKSKSEKDLFLNRINQITAIADCLHDKIIERSISLIEATSRLKRIRSSVRCIYQAFASTNKLIGITEVSVQAILKEINTLMTYTPSGQEVEGAILPICISNNVCTYSVSRSAEIEGQIELLKNTLFRIQIEINNSYPLS